MCEVVHVFQQGNKLLLFSGPVSQPVNEAQQNICKNGRDRPQISSTLSSRSSFDVDKHAAAGLGPGFPSGPSGVQSSLAAENILT